MDDLFEASTYEEGKYKRVDYKTEAEGKAAIEKVGAGSLVHFTHWRNRSGCQPEWVAKSLDLQVFEKGAWREVFIH